MPNKYVTQLKNLNMKQSRKQFQNLIGKLSGQDLKYAEDALTKSRKWHTTYAVQLNFKCDNIT